jgi:hypothetical protein
MEVIDGSNHRNVYQNKRNIQGETRMAITTHADADLGVCFTNTLDKGESEDFQSSTQLLSNCYDLAVNNDLGNFVRAVDLDVDIGADAVDYNAIAKAGTPFTYYVQLLNTKADC